MILESLKFIFYSILIVVISKYVLVTTLRKLAESLTLKAKTVGDLAGYATSVPEFLTITISSIRGLPGASIYNILSSNIINLIQYLGSIIYSRNLKKINNKVILADLIMVFFTILIPIFLLQLNAEVDIFLLPVFIMLYILFKILNSGTHRFYLENESKQELQNKKEKIDKKRVIKYSLILFLTGILLFIIGELLGNTLENLCNIFNVSEIIVGILLGFITSIPELITFFESQKYHKKSENSMLGVVEATNNLLTSNTLNLFLIYTIGVFITSI